MSIKVFEYKGIVYPEFEKEGFAAQFCFPFARKVCKGIGYDIGCMRKDWSFPGSIPIDICFNEDYNATNLPDTKVDYIFSSHCLEHLENWIIALEYWTARIKDNGVLFLYLPNYSQEYWRPWNNRKHLHCLNPIMIKDWMKDNGYYKIFYSSEDLNNSFTIMAEKKETQV